MTVQIIKERDPVGAHVVHTGDVTGKEIVEINGKLANNSTFTYQLVDFTGTDKLDISSDEMHSIALQDKFIPETSQLTKVAIVGRKEILNNIDQIYHVYSGVWLGRTKKFESQTFRSLAEARQWIGC